jgi:ubiquinone/menaquinone biosynthesis C-methylase UbiE
VWGPVCWAIVGAQRASAKKRPDLNHRVTWHAVATPEVGFRLDCRFHWSIDMTDSSEVDSDPLGRAPGDAAALSDYYAQRAPHYEEVYHKPERQADLKSLKQALALALNGRRVLDVACGTGYFTAAYAAHADSVLGIDSNQAVLDLARRKMLPDAEFQQGDAYLLDQVSARYDAALVSFWWSHVPNARRDAFLQRLHQCLAPNARVILIDNRFVPGNSTPIALIDGAGDQWQDRPRQDGTRQLVMKNYPTRQLLLDSVPGSASTHWWQLEYYWWFDYLRP